MALVLAGCSAEQFPQSALEPKADFARMIDELFTTTVKWALIVFVLVEGALLYAVFRFRAKPGDAEPAQIHGNTTLEIVWTIIPAVILAMIAVPTVQAIFKTYDIPDDNPLVIEVLGHQWWWEFRYPEFGITTANEMHVPVGRTVSLVMGTTDVLHSFWIPQLAGKRDVFPNRETTLWFKAEEPGNYPGACAEFCGLQHGKMAHRVIAQTPEEFASWVAFMEGTGKKPAAPAQAGPAQGPAPTPAPAPTGIAATGEKLFATKGCIGCHALSAVNAPALVGPNLAGIGRRTTIAAGTMPNTDENLAAWIRDPQRIKTGVLMPTLGLTEAEAQALAAYLRGK